MTETTQTKNPRVEAIFTDVVGALLDIIKTHRVTWEEYRAATEWLTEAGNQGYEIPLMLDVFLSQTVDDVSVPDDGATASNVEGPFYVPDAPRLAPPYVLPHRDDEPGEPLHFTGTVRSTDGAPLACSTIDVWQANGIGEYSNFHPTVPEFNLRGRFTTDADGRFEFVTVLPSSYSIPSDGATGRLLAALGRHPFRPGHIHFRVSHEDARTLTTQIYFEGDPYIDSDVVDLVKDSLIIKVERHLDEQGDTRANCSYDFCLAGGQQ